MKTNLKHLPEFIKKMKSQAMPEQVIENFSYYYKKVVNNEKGLISDSDIIPIAPEKVKMLEELGDYADYGKKIFNNYNKIKLTNDEISRLKEAYEEFSQSKTV